MIEFPYMIMNNKGEWKDVRIKADWEAFPAARGVNLFYYDKEWLPISKDYKYYRKVILRALSHILEEMYNRDEELIIE